jgi:hypothetical protein
MKSVNDVKRFYREAALRTNRSQDEAVLADALRAGGLARGQLALRAEPSIWRTIMKSRATKLVTAAVIVAAILISISHVNETVVKAVEFEEITQAMQHVPWMHAVATGFEPRTGGLAEQWIGFESKIHAGRLANGTALFLSEKDHQQLDYDPNSRTITVRYLESLPLDMTSPPAVLTTMHQLLEQQGAQIVAKMGSYQGRKVQIQDITLSNVGEQGGSQSLTLYVDPDSKLIHAAEAKALDSAGKVVMAGTITFDYPSSGPQGIYDLGVPRDARTGDNGPQSGIQTFLDQYQRIQAETTREYIAVIAKHESIQSEDMVTTMDVDYKSGRKHRQERHFVFHTGEVFIQLWPIYKEQLGDSFESLFAWRRKHYDDPRASLSISLHDGQYSCFIQRDGERGWGKLNKQYFPGGDAGSTESLSHQAWPPIGPTARIIEDDYAGKNGWVCLEALSQGLVMPNGWASLPGRFLYYLDPSRDYLCRREVDERRRDASWQKDKTWLAGVDPKKVSQDSTTVVDITEAAQAPNDHWYPQTIVESHSGQATDLQGRTVPYTDTVTKKVYVQVAPKFPDGVFDVDKLPGQ